MSASLTSTVSLPRIEELPDDPAVLRGMVEQLVKLLTAANGTIETLQQQVEQMVRRLYGRSSEKWDPNQALMDEVLAAVLEQRAALPKATDASIPVKIEAHTRHVTPHGRSIFPETLKHEEIVIPVPEAERMCPITGQERPVIGYEISKKLDYRQPELVVKVYKREKRGSVANAEETGVVTAPAPECPVPKSVMDNGLIAHVVVSKFEDHLPLYRQEKIFKRQGVALSRRTMCDTLLAAAEPLSLLADRIKAKVLANELVHHDDTPVDMLTEGMSHTNGIKEARLWVATVPGRDGPWTHFQFSTSREGRHIEDFFREYHGAVMSDDFIGYDRMDKEHVLRLLCWAHVRRKFFEAQGSNPLEAAEMLERIRLLYKLEHSVEVGPEHDERRLEVRRAQARPQLDAMIERMKAWSVKAPPKTPLGKALSYALTNWPCLIRYVDDPRLPLDNNPAEQAIRPVAVGRKNWLFMGSERGGRAAAVYMTLLATCRRAKVNPFDYLQDILRRIMSHSTRNLDELLPGNWTPLRS
jgi:transposase